MKKALIVATVGACATVVSAEGLLSSFTRAFNIHQASEPTPAPAPSTAVVDNNGEVGMDHHVHEWDNNNNNGWDVPVEWDGRDRERFEDYEGMHPHGHDGPHWGRGPHEGEWAMDRPRRGRGRGHHHYSHEERQQVWKFLSAEEQDRVKASMDKLSIGREQHKFPWEHWEGESEQDYNSRIHEQEEVRAILRRAAEKRRDERLIAAAEADEAARMASAAAVENVDASTNVGFGGFGGMAGDMGVHALMFNHQQHHNVFNAPSRQVQTFQGPPGPGGPGPFGGGPGGPPGGGFGGGFGAFSHNNNGFNTMNVHGGQQYY